MALTLVILLFFLCGFGTVLNTTLIPYLKNLHGMSYSSIILIQTSFYLAYFLISPISGNFFRNRSYLPGIRFAIVCSACGCLIIAFSTVFQSFLFGEFILGSGVAIHQVILNLFVINLGNKKTSASRLTLCQASMASGMLVAPFVGSFCLLSGYCTTHLWLYLLLGVLWIMFYPFFYLINDVNPEKENKGINPLKDPAVILGFIAISLSIGIEVTIASFLVSFLTDLGNISPHIAGNLTMFYWGGFVLGRLIGSIILKYFPSKNVLLIHLLSGIFFSIVVVTTHGTITIFAVLGLGLFTSILFPVFFDLVITNCHSNRSQVSGILCMGNIGGASIPLIQGVFADLIGLHFSFIIPMICYGLLVPFTILIDDKGKISQNTPVEQ